MFCIDFIFMNSFSKRVTVSWVLVFPANGCNNIWLADVGAWKILLEVHCLELQKSPKKCSGTKPKPMTSWIWWVCYCGLKCVPEPDKSLISSRTFLRVSSFNLNSRQVLFLPNTFSKEQLILTRSPRLEFGHDKDSVSSRWRISLPYCVINLWGDKIINRGQKSALDPILNGVNNVTPFFVSLFIALNPSNDWFVNVFTLAGELLQLLLALNFRSPVP